jgi:hypothetical protein
MKNWFFRGGMGVLGFVRGRAPIDLKPPGTGIDGILGFRCCFHPRKRIKATSFASSPANEGFIWPSDLLSTAQRLKPREKTPEERQKYNIKVLDEEAIGGKDELNIK